MSYYKELQRAIRTADHIINELLYIEKVNIDLNELEINQSSRFQCNFMKIFHTRLKLYMARDENIILTDKKVSYKE